MGVLALLDMSLVACFVLYRHGAAASIHLSRACRYLPVLRTDAEEYNPFFPQKLLEQRESNGEVFSQIFLRSTRRSAGPKSVQK